MAVSHGCQPWLSAMAASHGRQPRPPATAANHGRQQRPFPGGHFFRRPNSTFPRFRRISSNETSKIRFSRRSHRVPFFFRPKRTLRGPGRAKNVFFSRLWLLHFSRGRNIFLKFHVLAHFCEAIFGVQTLHYHVFGGFQALRPRNSDSPGEFIVCHFFFIPNRPLEAPAMQKTYFFFRLWLKHDSC